MDNMAVFVIIGMANWNVTKMYMCIIKYRLNWYHLWGPRGNTLIYYPLSIIQVPRDVLNLVIDNMNLGINAWHFTEGFVMILLPDEELSSQGRVFIS